MTCSTLSVILSYICLSQYLHISTSQSLPAFALIPLPSPVSSGYTATDLNGLWQSVEQTMPVISANITNVQDPLQNFTVGPEPPRFRPSYLVANTSELKLPSGFKYGVATAATQVEGAVKAGGRGPSGWDWACHNYPPFCNNLTADVTINHYYQYKRDIQRAKAMGVNTISFSVAWSRIYPFGVRDSPVSEEGMRFYDDFINELLDNGIEPVLTLFHWDTPLNLISQYGAFLNESIVADYANYAATVFGRYGKKVKMWVTFNEPRVYCSQYSSVPYNQSYTGTLNNITAPYACTYHLLKAHGTAVKVYRALKDNGTIAEGQIGLKHDGSRPVPFDPSSAADREVVERVSDLYIGIFSQPIYGDGNYPARVRDTIPTDILPALTQEDQQLIRGSADFYAIDPYSTHVAKAPPTGIEACVRNISDPNWPICQDVSGDIPQYSIGTGWGLGAAADPLSPWLSDTSSLLRYQLRWLTDNFPAPGGIYISEFGFAEPYEYLRTELYQITWDERRSNYLLDYLNEALLAIHEDGIPLKGTFIWSLADNFEWNLATLQRFGLQHVNYSTPDLKRSFKLSFFQVRDFFRQHLVD